MRAQKYPIGVQTFSKIIEGGYAYVDKTAFVEKLTRTDGYYFLSRPRRFGKSLLLSTLHAYFDGRRDLFKGLALDRMNVDWTPTPVIHIDLNSENYSREDGLENKLDLILREYEREYGITEKAATPAGRFSQIIRTVYEQTGTKIAILIDEYDKPLLEIEEDPEMFLRNQATLKAMFGNLKSMDRYIRFALLTGVARFNKVSIFSDLNNLYDISLSDEFADICGLTEEEMLSAFRPGIEQLAQKRGENYEATVDILRNYYDGYLFAVGGNRLYNPYSVLTALRDMRIRPYWFRSATPQFLARRVVNKRIRLEEIGEQSCSEEDLLKVGLNSSDPFPLMFQTGYLTIKSYDETFDRYVLDFPNREVEIGFAKELYPLYLGEEPTPLSPFNISKFQDDLNLGRPEEFMLRLQTLIKDMPYEMQNESNYQNMVWLLSMLCATDVTAERHSYKGRSDLEVITPNIVYIFEFKYNKNAQTAMEQLLNRDYAGRFAMNPRPVYLIGADFSTDKNRRGLTEWIITPLNQ